MENSTENNQTPPPQSAAPATPSEVSPQQPPQQVPTTTPPISARPNKSARIPKHESMMASDPTVAKDLLKAIERREDKKQD